MGGWLIEPIVWRVVNNASGGWSFEPIWYPSHRGTPVCTADFSPLQIHIEARCLLGNTEEGGSGLYRRYSSKILSFRLPIQTVLLPPAPPHLHPGRLNSIKPLFTHSFTNLILNEIPFGPATVLDAGWQRWPRGSLPLGFQSQANK